MGRRRNPGGPIRLRPALRLALIALGAAAGCVGSLDAYPVPQLPGDWEPLPPCDDALPGAFALPDLSAPSGLLATDPAPLQPIGHELSLHFVIRDPGGTLDEDFDGALTVVSDAAGFEVLSVSPAGPGARRVRYRLDSPGRHVLSATVSDGGRTGGAEIVGYSTHLPLWDLEVAPDDWELLHTADPLLRTRVPVVLTVAGEGYPATMRLHGGSTLYYAKKSYRIDLDPDADGPVELPDGADHLILRAEFPDKAMLRNYLSSELFRSGTWLPASRIEPVHLRVNGSFLGLYQRAERVDADWLEVRGLSRDGPLYEADPPLALSSPGGNLTPLPAARYAEVYQHHRGPTEYTDLIELIEDVLAPGGRRYAEAPEVSIAVHDVLVYAAVQTLIQNQDHLRKNFYLYRDPAADEDRWRFLPWDMDLAWGHLWTPEDDILDEQITADATLWIGLAPDPTAWDHNGLLHRVLSDPDLAATYERYLLALTETVFHPDFVQDRIDGMLCRTKPELLADSHKRASNEEYLGRVDELLDFLAARRAFVTEQLAP